MNRENNRVMIPEWMLAERLGAKIHTQSSRGSSKFLLKTIVQMRKTLSEEISTERLANRPGLLQGIDPRVKLIGTIALILLVGMTRSIYLLLGLWLLTVVLMYLSRLPIYSLEKRIWGIIPLWTLLAASPALFNIINDGTPLLMLHQWSEAPVWLGMQIPATLFISKQGAMAVLFLFLRVGISVSLGVLLTITTPVARLLRSLQTLKVPALFIMIIEMTYRYLMLLLSISIEMFEARSQRTVGSLSLRKRQAMVGSSLAALFVRSMSLSDEVYQAMTARCYTGEAVYAGDMRWRRLDIISLFVIIALVSMVVIGEFVLG
ncbi:MAG: cobalt ECF transporter T component CbiQ [Syntrophomonadaceae bacterium]|nr:cobalt ECF transporter T component CbiQ [Syntrophomonadaceae bacterium]